MPDTPKVYLDIARPLTLIPNDETSPSKTLRRQFTKGFLGALFICMVASVVFQVKKNYQRVGGKKREAPKEPPAGFANASQERLAGCFVLPTMLTCKGVSCTLYQVLF